MGRIVAAATHVHVGKNCSVDESEAYKALFKEFHDIFSWSYEEMPGIDPSIVERPLGGVAAATVLPKFLKFGSPPHNLELFQSLDP